MDSHKAKHMKNIFLVVLLLSASVTRLQAQTFEEWFQQKKTQLRRLRSLKKLLFCPRII